MWHKVKQRKGKRGEMARRRKRCKKKREAERAKKRQGRAKRDGGSRELAWEYETPEEGRPPAIPRVPIIVNLLSHRAKMELGTEEEAVPKKEANDNV